MGLVHEFFDARKLQYLIGKVGVGHVRYSTTGSSDVENAQPFLFDGPRVKFAVALNGNLTNYLELKEELVAKGQVLTSTTDTEVIGHLLAAEFLKRVEIFSAVKNVMAKIEGAYSLLILTDHGRLIAVRDPLGFRPLCIGRKGDSVIIASESAALDVVEAEFERDVKPGEVFVVDSVSAVRSKQFAGARKAHCMFEWVYFARPDSVIEGKSVGKVREKLGEKLAELYPLDVDVVVPIPDSGRSAAYGYCRKSGKRMGEGLIKNRYIWRTFIMPGDKARSNSVRLKLNPARAIVEGKRVALVDDSLVRGTTTRKIAKLVRSAGAKEVHLLVSCPPLKAPCFMGIAFPTYAELAASRKSVEEIRKEVGLDSLNYMAIDGLVEAIGLDKKDLCLACLTDEYPVRISEKTRICCSL